MSNENNLEIIIKTRLISFPSFDTFMKDTSEENLFNLLWLPGQLEEFNFTSENTRVILSLGGGSSVQQAYFPNIFTNVDINPPMNPPIELDKPNYFFIIAFDETFSDGRISDAFRMSIINHLRKVDSKQLNVDICIACISENVPACRDNSIVCYNAHLLQTNPDATFDDLKPCRTESDTFPPNFMQLIHEINEHKIKLYVHHDAWFDTTFPTEHGKFVNIMHYGSNFESLSIIPHILGAEYNKDNVFLIQSAIRGAGIIRDSSRIIPFFSRAAVSPYSGVDFTNPRVASALGCKPIDAAVGANGALGGAGGPPKPRRGGARTKTRRTKHRSYRRHQSRK